MNLRSWFMSKRKIVDENERLKQEAKRAIVKASHLKALLDRATIELRGSLDQMAKNFAMIKLERDVLRTELYELKRSLDKADGRAN